MDHERSMDVFSAGFSFEGHRAKHRLCPVLSPHGGAHADDGSQSIVSAVGH